MKHPTFKDGTPDIGCVGLARLLVKKAAEAEAARISKTTRKAAK